MANYRKQILGDPSKHLQFLLSLSPHSPDQTSSIASSSKLADTSTGGKYTSGKARDEGVMDTDRDETRGMTRAEILEAWRSKQGETYHIVQERLR